MANKTAHQAYKTDGLFHVEPGPCSDKKGLLVLKSEHKQGGPKTENPHTVAIKQKNTKKPKHGNKQKLK